MIVLLFMIDSGVRIYLGFYPTSSFLIRLAILGWSLKKIPFDNIFTSVPDKDKGLQFFRSALSQGSFIRHILNYTG